MGAVCACRRRFPYNSKPLVHDGVVVFLDFRLAHVVQPDVANPVKYDGFHLSVMRRGGGAASSAPTNTPNYWHNKLERHEEICAYENIG